MLFSEPSFTAFARASSPCCIPRSAAFGFFNAALIASSDSAETIPSNFIQLTYIDLPAYHLELH